MPNSNRQRTLAGEIPEELIVTHILPKITDGACVGRCRCVCKSWRDLLSGPSLIRYHKMRSPDSSSSSSDYQILITGVDYKGWKTYSLHSAETLEPLLPTPNSIMLLPSTELHRDLVLMKVVGCCNGLFCLSGFDLDASMQLILWNPATSETKVLPPPSSPHVYLLPAVGFGFDSQTNDYKVFRQRNRREDCYYLPLYLMEVYSLRKDSWRVLEG
ncbi:unnamed protein product [Linum trigynum]|uniref:F-box associated beta-propeller type 1 domain-containing protein n=1 Tax=Linum trigynum TaxID=586398 RepID=A0AAV2FGY0_9ROSI